MANTSTGAVSAVAGIPVAVDPDDPSIVPVLPALPAARVALAAVDVPASTTAITNAEIIDKRMNIFSSTPGTYSKLLVRKTADTSRASTVTPTNDPDLFSTVGSNEVWRFEFDLLVTGAAGDFAFVFTWPTGGTLSAGIVLPNTSGTPIWNGIADDTSPSTTITTAISSNTIAVLVPIRVVYSNGSTSGNFQLQWCQASSNATATVLKTNSAMWGARLV